MSHRWRTTLVAAALGAAVLVSAACSKSSQTDATDSGMGSMTTNSATSTSGTAPAAGPHNDADVSFATDMIPHHAQAVEMAELALDKATSAKVTALASAIKSAQGPEITQMSQWLTAWKQPVPATTGGMAMGSGTGMMSAAEMAKLTASSGAAFDRLWVQMMITHHQGAVTMARMELADGQDSAAKGLAQTIITSQTTQVDQMTALLGELPQS